MADLCLCGLCKPREICEGRWRRILVTALDQPDATTMPYLWRMQWKSSILPVKVFGGQAVAGRQYMARLVCASSEYVIFIPEQTAVRLSQAMLEVLVQTYLPVRLSQAMLEVLVYSPVLQGVFYVLYEDGQILRITELQDGGGSAQWKPFYHDTWYQWDATGEVGVFISPSSLDQDPDQNTVDKVNLTFEQNTFTGMRFTSNSGDWSWDIIAYRVITNSANTFRKAKFDLTAQGVGFVPVLPYLSSNYETTIKNGFSPSDGDYSKTYVEGTWDEFYASNEMELTVYKTNDGGASWSQASLGYLGSILPARMHSTARYIKWLDAVPECTEGPGDLCPWDGTGSPPLPSGCSSGDTFMHNVSGPNNADWTWKATGGSGNWSIDPYHVCDAVDCADHASLVVHKPSTLEAFVAPMHDGGGYYVVVAASYESREASTLEVSNPVVTPLNNYTPDTTIYCNVIYRVTKSGVVTYWKKDVVSYNYAYYGVECDPSDPDKLYIQGGAYLLERWSWSAQTVTDISPVPVVDLGWLGNLAITSTGTIFVPLVVDAGGGNYKLRVYRSQNHGSTWDYQDFTAYTNDVWSESLQIARRHDDTVAMITTSGKVVFTEDDGATWGVTSQLGLSDLTWVNDIGSG